jgi:Domain of unknown function (DUF4280)
MPFHVCNGATLMCSLAVPPGVSTFVVQPIHRMLTSDEPAANINDHVPMVNIMPFGMCMSPSNPAFTSATSAAGGTPTPVPCTPATPAPWVTGAISNPVILDGAPALDDISTLQCTLGGTITISYPGETTETIP